MDLDKAIRGRHSTKKFKAKAPDWRSIIEAIDSARYTPMSGKNYSLKFILVDKKDKIKKIAESAQQPFIGQASYVVVVCSSFSRTKNLYGQEADVYLRQQAGAAIQNFLLKIEEAGLATCWIGQFVEPQIKHFLAIPDYVQVEAIFPVGYELEKKHSKSRAIELDRILYFNEWENDQMREERKLDT